jgi:hypothetical protein
LEPALLAIATILLGFRESYFPLCAKPVALSSWVIVLHGTVFSLFLMLFFVQVSLVSGTQGQVAQIPGPLGLWAPRFSVGKADFTD